VPYILGGKKKKLMSERSMLQVISGLTIEIQHDPRLGKPHTGIIEIQKIS
jgi:hypothetical protein